MTSKVHNAKLSSEQHYHLPKTLCRKHLSRFKPKVPSVANLLKFIVMCFLLRSVFWVVSIPSFQ
ncbi:hypothetical protein EJ063_19290 [Vibrio aquaticus]|uniref:Uncharacterized protein n=1 Tax=Vibrio aquaticus TaxID=2496559 RepID=A0A432CU37_9VIBR|nr:hypothetical protein EJ063_19290 [Vibrio aquaticus]